MWAHWGTWSHGLKLVPIGQQQPFHAHVVPTGCSSVASCSRLSWRPHPGLKEGLAVDSLGLGWVTSWQTLPSSPLLFLTPTYISEMEILVFTSKFSFVKVKE